MAVTIDNMEIDVKSGEAASAAQSAAAASPKEPVDLRQQMALLSERSQRLTAE
jgi:hypothetical protein